MARTATRCNAALGVIGLAAAAVIASSGAAHAQGGTPAAAPAEALPYYRWQDTSISLLPYGWGFKVDPSEQSALTFEHVHKTAIGDLFVFVDATKFQNGDGQGEWTWFGKLSPRLSLGK